MPFLFIGSTGDHAGQCLVAWAIARRLREKGVRMGFFKPFGTRPACINDLWVDPDAYLFKETFNLEEPLDLICPYILPEKNGNPDLPENILDEIRSLAMKLSAGKDLLIIIGSRHIFFDDAPHAVPDLSVIHGLNADTCLVHRYRKVSTTLYSTLSVNSLLKDNIKGTIINRIPNEQLAVVHDQLMPAYSQKEIRNVALLPEDPVLSLFNVGEIKDILMGKVLCGGEFLNRPVEGITVGASNLRGELLIFKRVYNKIVLLGPLSTGAGVSGILMTGSREPGRRVIEAAERSGIPLILVEEDAFSVKERLEQCAPTLTPADEDKVIHFTDLLDREDYLNRLVHSLGW